MVKLFTIRHGSWLYGTNNVNSDIDLKTIYLPDYSDMLMGKKLEAFKYRDSAEDESTKPDEVEDEYIPLQTFAQHFLGCQSYALELAFALLNDTCIEYVHPGLSAWTYRLVEELVENFTNSNVDSIVGYAYSQSLKYGLKGERLAAIEALIPKVEVYLEVNKQMVLGDIAHKWYTRDNKQPIFITDIEATRSNTAMEALSIGNKLYAFNTTLKHFLKALNILKDKYGERTKKALDGHDWKAISHSIRITGQGIELLETSQLRFPSVHAPYLLAVKNGLISEDEAYERLDILFKKLKITQTQTSLRPLDQELSTKFDRWLRGWLIAFYSTKESGND